LSDSTSTIQKRISFHFHPLIENNTFAVEKSLNNKKKRYLRGISSGIKTDQHGERMTERCVKSFMEQANSGEVLLFPDIHGIKQSEDIGRLTEARVLPNFDWETEFELHDEDIGEVKKEKIDTLWKQINGFPPYTRPIQKGFSVEGYIPEHDGIIRMSATGQRVIDSVLLDGVILVPRPAYKDSIANAIYKALDELPPWEVNKIKKNVENKLSNILKDKESESQYYAKKYEIEDSFQEIVEDIMQDPKDKKKERLESLFNEYKNLMIDLILSSSNIFAKDNDIQEGRKLQQIGLSRVGVKTLKSLESNLQKLLIVKQRSNK
jgi:hypothetical protein